MEGRAPTVDWKSLPEVGQDVRIVFEPNLPEDVLALVQAGVEDLIGTSLYSAQSGYLPSAVFVWKSEFMIEWFAEFHGVLWLEPQLETVGRNLESAEKMVGLGRPRAQQLGRLVLMDPMLSSASQIRESIQTTLAFEIYQLKKLDLNIGNYCM